MAQWRGDTQTFDQAISRRYEVMMLANNANGDIVSASNPLPVTLGSSNITITGDVNVGTTVNVASSPENPVHTHITEVGTSGLLTVPYLPVGGTVNIGTMPEVEIKNDSGNPVPVSGTVELANATINALGILFDSLNIGGPVDRLVTGTKEAILSSNGTLIVPGSIIPSLNTVFSLGDQYHKWGDLWVGPNTINMTDTATGNIAALSVTNGVLQIDGANQLQVGQLKFVDNTIQSTTGNITIQIGQTGDTSNLVFNRNVVTAEGKTITANGAFYPLKGITHPVRLTTIPANTVSINFETDELIHIHTPAPNTIVTATILNLANNIGKTIEIWTMSSAGGNTQFNHGVNSSQATNGQSFFLTSRISMYIKYFNLDGTTGNLFVTAIGNNLI